MDTATATAGKTRNWHWVMSIPFYLVHVAAAGGVWWLGWSWKGLGLAILLYYVRMFGVTGGYHRYFSHRTFKTGRAFQFVLGVLASTSAQKGILWWAGHHRVHHKYSDTDRDVHSAKLRGFWWSHAGWILSSDYEETDWDRIRDLAKYPELRWLNRYHLVPPTALAVALFFIGGPFALFWGFFVSTVLLWHGTFTINSLSHLWGRRRFSTTDDSRNNWVLAIVTMGEGWHNNHHHYQRSVNQGIYWWEIDVTYYILWLMSKVGLVWDLHTTPNHIYESLRAGIAPRSEEEEATANVASLAPIKSTAA